MLLHEKLIVSSRCIGIALHEALAAALGVETATAAPEPVRPPSEPLQGHVLLVEDEAVNAAVAEGYLEALGCTAAVGEERRRCGGAQRRRALRS